jgi:hypothetical protein
VLYRQATALQVQIGPVQAQQLPLAQCCRQRQPEQRLQSITLCHREQVLDLGHVQNRLGLLWRAWRAHVVTRIARQFAPGDRLLERSMEDGVYLPNGASLTALSLEIGIVLLNLGRCELGQRARAEGGDQVRVDHGPIIVLRAGCPAAHDRVEVAPQELGDGLPLGRGRDTPLLIMQGGSKPPLDLVARLAIEGLPPPLAVHVAQMQDANPAPILALMDAPLLTATLRHCRLLSSSQSWLWP